MVANEVKGLSGQVSKALGEISGQIHDIQTETRLSVESMNDILAIVREITDGSVIVASAVSQQSMVTQEISQNIHATAHEREKSPTPWSTSCHRRMKRV